MTDIKVPASGNIRVWWALSNAFANYQAPTAAEINACLDISDAISWNDFDFGLQASNTIDDPAITALGKVSDRGAAQFGGAISLYYPGAFGDATNKYSLAYDALDAPRTAGYLVMRIDGDEATSTAANSNLVEIFKVVTDGYAETIVGEEAFRYTITFLPQGDFSFRTVVGGSTPVITNAAGTSIATLSVAAGTKTPLGCTVGGRVYTNGVAWSTSDATKATVSTAGVVKAIAAGSVTITATYENATTSNTDTLAVTVT